MIIRRISKKEDNDIKNCKEEANIKSEQIHFHLVPRSLLILSSVTLIHGDVNTSFDDNMFRGQRLIMLQIHYRIDQQAWTREPIFRAVIYGMVKSIVIKREIQGKDRIPIHSK